MTSRSTEAMTAHMERVSSSGADPRTIILALAESTGVSIVTDAPPFRQKTNDELSEEITSAVTLSGVASMGREGTLSARLVTDWVRKWEVLASGVADAGPEHSES